MKFVAISLISLCMFQLCTCFTNKNVERKIDITTHIVKITHAITIEGSGNDYLVNIEPGYVDNLAFIGATTKQGDEETALPVKETGKASTNGRQFTVTLGAGKSQRSIVLTTVFTHKLRPYPAEITQAERQYVQFRSSVFFYSPYPTDSQETRVILPPPVNALSHTQQPKPVNKVDNAIVYGPYKDQQPFAQSELLVHYENNNPFLDITQLTRTIEISHWGNIAIEETLDVFHSGALLKGAFSRFDYQRNQGGASSVKSFKTVLPASARDVYYRDEIGNISTSHMREYSDYVEVELRPRFPLFGGWKTHYTLGYNVPTYEYLFRKGPHYGLRMRFVDHVFDDQVVDRITVKVILPEAVTNIRFVAPFPVEEAPRENVQTYLDTHGRTVIVAHKSNLVEQHIRDFQLFYDFHPWLLVREPLMLITAFLLLFVGVIVYVRLDFSITKDDASESRMRLSGFVEEVRATQDRRSALYQAYEDAVNKFKASKDSGALAQSRKKIDADHQQLTQIIAALHAKLKTDSPAAADKVNEVQAMDGRYREQVSQGVQLAERLVTGKLSKQVYMESEQKIVAKKSEILQRMEALVTSL